MEIKKTDQEADRADTIEKTPKEKLERLREQFQAWGRVAVAFSGGVDSAFLLKTAADTLGREQVLALTMTSDFIPERETKEAVAFCKKQEIPQILIDVDALSIPDVKNNPRNRCYLCKKTMCRAFLDAAKKRDFPVLTEGTVADDDIENRVGFRAITELGIKSPLRDAGLCKSELRAFLKSWGLSVATKPSYACMASRFVYGEQITKEKLSMVEKAEGLLWDIGIRQSRVRLHQSGKGVLARIEVPLSDIPVILAEHNRKKLTDGLKNIGFSFVTLDMEGFSSGSMQFI